MKSISSNHIQYLNTFHQILRRFGIKIQIIIVIVIIIIRIFRVV